MRRPSVRRSTPASRRARSATSHSGDLASRPVARLTTACATVAVRPRRRCQRSASQEPGHARPTAARGFPPRRGSRRRRSRTPGPGGERPCVQRRTAIGAADRTVTRAARLTYRPTQKIRSRIALGAIVGPGAGPGAMMTQNTTAEARRSRLALQLVDRGILGMTAIDAILFGVAGRLDWRAAWVLSVWFAVYLVAGASWFLRRDPDLLEERITRAANVPTWDRVLRKMYGLSLIALLATAALDAGRFRWSQMSSSAQFAGAAGLLVSFTVIWWCSASNHYLSSQSRIQADLGHRVVRNGPYRFVRHPMYTSLIVLMSSMALLLGSWLALVPALLIAALLVVRTVFEDRMLTDLLPGYREYASDVTRRLVPGIW